MAITYTTINTQIASLLRITRKAEAAWEHWVFDDNANFNFRLIQDEFDDTINEEAQAQRAAEDLLQAQGAILGDLFEQTRDIFDDALSVILDADLATAAAETEMIDYEHEELASGQISIVRRTGKLGALFNDMVDNAENVLRNNVTFGGLVAENGNRGTMVLSVAPTGFDHSLSGVVTLEVVEDAIGGTKFEITYDLDTPLVDTDVLDPEGRQPTLGQSFENGFTGLAFTLGQGTIIETDPNAFITVPVVATPSAGDSDAGGKYFLKITRKTGAPIWLLELFNTSDRDPGDKVGQDTADGVVGTDAISILCNNGSLVTFTFDLAAAAAAIVVGTPDESVIIDIDNPRLKDKSTFTVTNDEAGEYATKLAKLHRASFNSGAVASANFADAQAVSISMT